MEIYYSAARKGFFPLDLKTDYEASPDGWPDDAKEIDDEIYASFTQTEPPTGKMLSSDENGNPAWGDMPPQSLEDSFREAQLKQASLMQLATSRINALVEAQDDGDITPDEEAELTDLRALRTKLRRLDLSTAPDIAWPDIHEVMPE